MIPGCLIRVDEKGGVEEGTADHENLPATPQPGGLCVVLHLSKDHHGGAGGQVDAATYHRYHNRGYQAENNL